MLVLVGCAEPKEKPSLQVVSAFGVAGTGPGEFLTPRGLDWSADRLWVVDRSGRVQSFDSHLNPLSQIQVTEGDRGFALGILGNGKGGFDLCDTHKNRIRSFDGEGLVVAAFGDASSMALPQRAARARDGRLFVCQFGEGDDNCIRVFDRQGLPLSRFSSYGRTLGKLTRAMAILIVEGNVFVADASDRILVFDLDGEFQHEWGISGTGAGELRYPYGLAFRDGLIYVCEYANNRLQRFNLAGNPLGTFGGPGRSLGEFSGPWDITCGPDGRLYVCDSGNHRVVVLDPDQVNWEGVQG